mmetsp:Transcript_35069/g.104649  ORF Transcript_35069/g.104649 Transcript_35069/m.104649 type:complete len:346 (+) Transcript_35069:1031-2068(+)
MSLELTSQSSRSRHGMSKRVVQNPGGRSSSRILGSSSPSKTIILLVTASIAMTNTEWRRAVVALLTLRPRGARPTHFRSSSRWRPRRKTLACFFFFRGIAFDLAPIVAASSFCRSATMDAFAFPTIRSRSSTSMLSSSSLNTASLSMTAWYARSSATCTSIANISSVATVRLCPMKYATTIHAAATGYGSAPSACIAGQWRCDSTNATIPATARMVESRTRNSTMGGRTMTLLVLWVLPPIFASVVAQIAAVVRDLSRPLTSSSFGAVLPSPFSSTIPPFSSFRVVSPSSCRTACGSTTGGELFPASLAASSGAGAYLRLCSRPFGSCRLSCMFSNGAFTMPAIP